MKYLLSRCVFVLFVFIIFFSSSCINTKNVVYFDSLQDTSFISKLDAFESPIQANDILSISITSLSPQASAIFNTTNTVSNSTTDIAPTGSSPTPGYLVSMEGYIQLPILGSIKAAGLTKPQLKDYITKAILDKKLLIDPIVTIRHINFKVTVLGEVMHPTVVTAPNEKISLLEALGLAGDLTIYGKRENVLLIRELNGKKQVRRINLTSRNFFLSPYYYLQPNDIVYVEPSKARIASASISRQLLPTILSALSLIAIIVTRIALR